MAREAAARKLSLFIDRLDDAAAPDNSLGFLLIGASVLVPIILAYTVYAYWVFRGKVNSVGGYH